MKMNKKIIRIFYALETLGFLSLVMAQSVYAAAGSEDDLGYFLTQIGDFLIRTIGPGVLVIGVAVAGVSTVAVTIVRGLSQPVLTLQL